MVPRRRGGWRSWCKGGGSSKGRRAVVVHMLLLLLGVTWGRSGDLLAPQDSQYDHLLETLLPSAPPRPRHPRRREGKEALGNNSRGWARRPHPRRGRDSLDPLCPEWTDGRWRCACVEGHLRRLMANGEQRVQRQWRASAVQIPMYEGMHQQLQTHDYIWYRKTDMEGTPVKKNN